MLGTKLFSFARNKLACSFCGKDASAIDALLAGPNVFICNECVAACNRILAAEAAGQR